MLTLSCLTLITVFIILLIPSLSEKIKAQKNMVSQQEHRLLDYFHAVFGEWDAADSRSSLLAACPVAIVCPQQLEFFLRP